MRPLDLLNLIKASTQTTLGTHCLLDPQWTLLERDKRGPGASLPTLTTPGRAGDAKETPESDLTLIRAWSHFAHKLDGKKKSSSNPSWAESPSGEMPPILGR